MKLSSRTLLGGGVLAVGLLLAGALAARSRSTTPEAERPRTSRPKPLAPSPSVPPAEDLVPRTSAAATPGGDTLKAPVPAPRPAEPRAPRGGPRPLDVESIQRRILDREASMSKRLDAVKELRNIGGVGGLGGVGDAMAGVLRTETEENVRVDLCKLMRGADSPEWRRQLLTSAQSDASPRVRREAIASLAPLALEPVDRQLLEQAASRETDPLVQREYKRMLSGSR